MYIAVVNYRMGNIRSVENAFKSMGIAVKVTDNPGDMINASAVVLPGVGAFEDVVKNLKTLNLYDAVIEAIKMDKPFLGICIGLQVLFEYGTEGQGSRGLGIFNGTVKKIAADVKIPHMGWNRINIIKKNSRIFKDIKDGESFYFVHSYFVDSTDKGIINSVTEYGTNMVCGIEKSNIYGLQFHPEKSSISGLKVLKNFADIAFFEGSKKQ